MDVGLDSVNLTQFRSLGVDDVAFLGKNRHELPGTNNKDYEFHNFGKFMILSEGVNTILRRMEDNFAAYYDLNIIFLVDIFYLFTFTLLVNVFSEKFPYTTPTGVFLFIVEGLSK